jgi:hypothetical protein
VIDRAFGSIDAVEAAAQHERTERFRTRDLLLSVPAGRRRAQDDAAPLLEALAKIYVAIRDQTGCSVIVDSSKNPAFGYLLGCVPELDVFFVHLVRDATAVAYSLGKRKESEPGRHLPRKTARQASADWLLRNLACDRFLARGAQSVRVRYEDMVREPADVIRSIGALTGNPIGDIGFLDQRDAHMAVRPHSVFGNPVRFEVGAVRLRLDDAWRDQMPRADAALVRLVTAPLRFRYGYLGLSGATLHAPP